MSIPREVFEKYAFEYQSKISESSKQLAVVRAQLQGRDREKRLSELTAKELNALPADVSAYRSVGKMFLKEDIAGLKDELNTRATAADKDLVALKRAETKLDRELKDAEKSFDSLLKKVLGQ
ncbi:Prefoldin [Entophlyctis helioformis]|nr:Prefoldin [Entophlyctis helioformis]